MPTFDHEALLLLFRNATRSAAVLLRELDVQIPEFDEVCTESSNLSDLQPAEYRADLVLFLQRGTEKVMGVIVEIQLGRDEDKPCAWPAYVANLRARHRCPVCLLVVTLEESVARWAGNAIELGPGSRCTPWVIGPSNMPAFTDLQEAEANVELAVLSAIEHGQGSNASLAEKVASSAMVAAAGLDAERSQLYCDLIFRHLSENALRAIVQTMNSSEYKFELKYPKEVEWILAFNRQYRKFLDQRRAEGKVEGRAEGRAEGRVEGQLKAVLKLLALRFGPLPEAVDTRIRAATGAQLDALTEQVLTAQTLDEALSPLA